jgi:tetratricopeptide (TPR) repeat protein
VKSEYLIINATYDDKSEFYKLKAEIYKSIADKNIDVAANLTGAVAAYNQLIFEENLEGQFKYIMKAKEAIKLIKNEMKNSADEDIKSENYADAAKKMYGLYNLDKKDTINLYLSTSCYIKMKDYDAALANYKELLKINYTGKGMEYYAVNKKTNIEELFLSASDREISIKAGFYDKPKNVLAKSKKNEIYMNMGLIYSKKKDLKSAESIYKQMIVFDPKNAEPYLELTYTLLDQKRALSEQMSLLGTSPKEMLAYDKLKLKMDDIVKEAISNLEKANTIEPKNTTVSDLLLKMYRSMDLIAEYNTLKARM